MIVYQKTLYDFIVDSNNPIQLVNEILYKLGRKKVSSLEELSSEESSWKESLPRLASILDKPSLEKTIDVALEYKIHQTGERIDFLIYGNDENEDKKVVVVELKQWSSVRDANKPYYIFTHGGGGLQDYQHPSYQAFNYVNLIKLFNEYVQSQEVDIISCSYLHNLPQEFTSIKNEERYPLIIQAPVFVKGDETKLFEYVSKNVKKPNKSIIYGIDNGRIVPSKKFGELFSKALKGNLMFSFDEKQMYSISTIIESVEEAVKYNQRKTILIKGSPGTGKSIIALNAIGMLLNPKKGKPLNSAYVTANSALRIMYEQLVEDSSDGETVSKNVFKNPKLIASSSEFDYQCLFVDEAHRIYKWKFGIGVKKSIDILDKIFYSSRVNVFFIDEDQAVTTKDFATIDKLRTYARNYKSELIEGPNLSLTSQFRILGGVSYINFIRNFLGYENNEVDFKGKNYDFRVFDDPNLLREELKKKDLLLGKSRMIAGYTYDWKGNRTDRNSPDYHIYLENGFKAKWNLELKGNYSYILDENSFEEVGCIYTIQGMDLNYAGVIIGPDLRFDGKTLVFDKTRNAKSDYTSGIRTADDMLAKKLIRNTYNVLLTRGIYGTFVYCEDKALAKYLKSLIGENL
jgi:DUF2075 family protein